MKNKMIKHTVACPKCGKTKDFMLEESRVIRWRNGEHIQRVFPELNCDDREMLITGICEECWSRIFGSEEEE